jgi:4-hydroxy-L-threonine phosphate dehydrogenase PdxA
MMNYKPILIVAGEPNSIFNEILIKSLKKKKIKSPIILIVSIKVFKLQMKKLKFDYPYQIFKNEDINGKKIDNKKLIIIDVDYNTKNAFEKISSRSNRYIEECFKIALKLIKLGYTDKFINGPISKKHFLKNKFLGITEYLARKTNSKKYAMLIYNKELSVCPITTHLPIKYVAKKISKKLIIEKVLLINNFYIKHFNFKPKIAITGINPHCESVSNFDEDKNIVEPAIKFLKRKADVTGPMAADTAFLRKNRKKFDLIFGMYHDQVLTPIKTLYEYNATNITIGLPFLRLSPDHGPNERMMGKNLSNPQSLIESLNFLDH